MKEALKKAFLVLALVAVAVFFAPATQTEAQQVNRSFGTCYAYTSCPYGPPIYCRVSGSSTRNMACSWYVVPGRSVECHGFVSNGYGIMWQDYFFTCGY